MSWFSVDGWGPLRIADPVVVEPPPVEVVIPPVEVSVEVPVGEGFLAFVECSPEELVERFEGVEVLQIVSVTPSRWLVISRKKGEDEL